MAFYCPRCGLAAEQAGTCARDGTALVAAEAHDLVGRTLGEYTVLARIGGGAFGHVYRAIHPRSNLVVAIKLLDQPIDAAESQRAITEARAAAAIRHENVVQVYDLALTTDRRPYIVMEYLDGQTLVQRWQQRVAFADVLPIATAILRGLAAAHRLGIVHRDLKPDNVFVTAGSEANHQRVVIVDFGLAKLLADPHKPNLTITGASLGTPRYMSPEQIRGQPVDGRSDLYALGVMIYEALAGGPPFDASSTFQLFDAHVNAPPPLGQLPRDVPPQIVDAIDRALAKAPADRFADADAMRRALAAPAPVRRRWPYVAGAVGVAALVTVVAIAAHGGHGTPAAPAPPPQRVHAPAIASTGDAKMDAALQQFADNVANGLYDHDDLVQLMCTTSRALAHVPAAAGEFNRTYLVRLRQMLRAVLPGFDEATCVPPKR